jgi:hypothetical protein
MDFEDTKQVILYRFRDNFLSLLKQNPELLWVDFIESLDLGIISNYNSDFKFIYYTIVDEKKWFLAKLKYGF